MARRVKVGIVGLGQNGVVHLRAHARSNTSEVVAVCDCDPDKLARVQREFGISKLYDNEDFFADDEIEAINIQTGDSDHYSPFLAALKHHKHVLVEKPLANTEAEAVAMVKAAQSAPSHLRIQVGYILRFHPVYCAIKELCQAGKLGHVYYMECDYIHNLLEQKQYFDPVTNTNWYLDHEQPMVGGGSHGVDLLRWLSGKEASSVMGYANHFAFPEMKHDDCQVALFRFEDGSIAKVASLYAPRMDRPPYFNLRLYGTKGTVERDQAALSTNADDIHPDFHPVTAPRIEGHPFEPEIDDWINAILENRPTRTPIEDAANSTIASLRACAAIEQNKELKISIIRPKIT